MEEPQPNPLKSGLWSLEVNWGEGGLKDGKDPLTSSKMNSQQWIYFLQFLFVCLSFIKLNRPKLSFQQENFGNIINSRHVAFPVKMAGIHHTEETDVFHVHSGWCRDNIPSIPPCRSLHFEFFPHNQLQFFTLTLRLSKNFCQTRCCCLFLLFFLGHWWLLWKVTSACLAPCAPRRSSGDAGPPPLSVLTTSEQGMEPGALTSHDLADVSCWVSQEIAAKEV